MAGENGSHVQCPGAEGELPHVSVGIPAYSAYSRREEHGRPTRVCYQRQQDTGHL